MKFLYTLGGRFGKGTRRMLAGASGLLLALAICATLVTPVLAIPPQPHQFWGTVTVDGSPASAGTEVLAKIGGVTYGSGVVDSMGRYGWETSFFVDADDPDDTGKTGGVNGDTISFYVAGVHAWDYEYYAIAGRDELNLEIGEVTMYDLTVTSGANGTTTPAPGVHSYPDGTVVSLSATPTDACYQFSSWTGPVANPASATTTVTMDGNKTVGATFALKQLDLTVGSSAGGSVTTPGEGVFTLDCGTVQNLVAAPDACYQFVNWTGPVADANSATTTVTVNAATTVTANFAVKQYNLTIGSSAGGSVTTPGEGVFTLDCGTVQSLEATAGEGYEFSSWTGPVANPNSATTTVTVNAATTVTANFSEIGTDTYNLTVAVGTGDGTTTPAPGVHSYADGTIVGLEAIAGECYEFAGWDGDVANPSSATTTVTMDGDKTVTANFSPIEYTLTVSSTDGGSVAVPGEGIFTLGCNDVQSLVATADPGYEFASWTGGVANPSSATTTVTMSADKVITAHFAPIGALMQVEMGAGWNTFSTPIVLDPCVDTWGEMVAVSGLNVEVIYGFDSVAGIWDQMTTDDAIQPLFGYYVYMVEAGSARIIPNTGPTALPSKSLTAGLNLIGLAKLTDWDVKSAMSSAYSAPGGLPGYVIVINPAINIPNDWDANVYLRDGLTPPTMKVGKAYWVVMENPDILWGFTTTPLP